MIRDKKVNFRLSNQPYGHLHKLKEFISQSMIKHSNNSTEIKSQNF